MLQNEDADLDNGLVDTVGEAEEGPVEEVASTHVNHQVSGILVRSCCVTQGAQSGAL